MDRDLPNPSEKAPRFIYGLADTADEGVRVPGIIHNFDAVAMINRTSYIRKS